MILELCTDIWTPSFTILKKRPVSFILFYGSSPKWTVHGGLTGRSKRLTVDDHISKWTVCESGRSVMKNWTAQMNETGWMKSKGWKWTVHKTEGDVPDRPLWCKWPSSLTQYRPVLNRPLSTLRTIHFWPDSIGHLFSLYINKVHSFLTDIYSA